MSERKNQPDLKQGLMHGKQLSADSRLLRSNRDALQVAAEVSQIENSLDKRTEFSLELVVSIIQSFEMIQGFLESADLTNLPSDNVKLASKAKLIEKIAELSLAFRQFTADVYIFVAELFDENNSFQEVARRLIVRRDNLLEDVKKFTTSESSLQTAISTSKEQNSRYKPFLKDVMHSRALSDSIHILLNDLYGVANFSDNLARNLRTQISTNDKDSLQAKARAHVDRIMKSKRSGQERTLQLLNVLEEGYKPNKLVLVEVFGNVEFWLDGIGKKVDKNFRIISKRSEIDENDNDYIICAMGYIKMWVENVISNAKKSFDKRVKEYRELHGQEVELPEELQGLQVSLECYYEGSGLNRRVVFAITDNGVGVTNPAATREMGKVSLELNKKVNSTYGTSKDGNPTGTGTGMSVLQNGLWDLTNNTGRLLVESVVDQDFGAKSSISFATPENEY